MKWEVCTMASLPLSFRPLNQFRSNLISSLTNFDLCSFIQVFWYHGSSIIDPQGLYGEALASSDIRLTTQRGELLRSQLTIQKVRSNHSGNYTCSPTMSAPANVIVHVISGKTLIPSSLFTSATMRISGIFVHTYI